MIKRKIQDSMMDQVKVQIKTSTKMPESVYAFVMSETSTTIIIQSPGLIGAIEDTLYSTLQG
jgi:hypothetical protein